MNIYEIEESAREQSSQSAASAAQDVERSDLRSKRAEIDRDASRALEIRDRCDEYLGRIVRSIMVNPQLDSADPLAVAGRLIATVGSGTAAYALDYMIFGSMASFLIGIAGGGAWFVGIAKILVPAVIVGVEFVISTLRYHAILAGKRIASFAWTVVGIGILATLSALAASTFLAAQDVDQITDMPVPELILLVVLVVLSAVPHGLILFGGKLAYEGKGALWLSTRRFRARRLDRRYQKLADKALMRFREVEDKSIALDGDSWLRPGLFSESTRTVINERLGWNVIPGPDEPFPPSDGRGASSVGPEVIPPNRPLNGAPAYARGV